ncbi:Hermansky-Pudlak syndrome 5 protein like protein [Habropoda laboriosa]|uniref:Hermansky-Pudlak syndrome 5 protein like protein n=1 Tax=Habropoda laboriosa TaxID=597456 RepID=A0A0L7R637_9HYME|nr:Hermansky-Pudlak syndrome 5 protein like protein [Habropoda laboriosa]
MQEFPYVLSEYEEINPLLYKPINSTQRIKYTCFNTSVNYIVLGSTSGSIYLFSRKPCSFIQLIPLSQGAVSRVLISPDEKTIALTTTRGAVCLVALKPTPKLIATSTEHIHEQINCLCWNDNSSEIYIGDDNGIISVMVLSIFTVNSMFQAPASTLMNLDSAIVQLCFSSPLLLVSTLTRCYICDTVQEQYKQIGNKARNGEFEGNSKVQEENFPQIFCARPGSRLWEVSANGIVIKTHQFKEALAMPPVAICRPNDRKSIYHKQTEQTWQPQSINFSHLFVVAEKYLFSYTSTGLYIIDPAIATVVLWNNEFSNINLAETIENKIYLMTSDGEFHCLSLSFLDSLILRLYNKKKYNECLEICLLYKVQLKKLVNNTEINNICDIENKLPLVRDDELPTLLHPLVILLESNTKIVPKKLESGIVVVNDGNSDLKNEEHFRRNSVPHCSLQNKESLSETELKIESKRESNLVTDSMNKMRKSKDTNCNTTEETYESKHAEVSETKEEVNSSKTITQRIQADLEVIYALVDNIRPSMDEDELEKIILDVDWKMDVIKDSYETLTELTSFMYEVLRSVELYYFNALLENISMQLIQSTDNENIIKQIMKAFININAQSYGRDDVVLSILLPSLDRQNWNFVATYAKEIQDEQCLFCEKSMKRGNNEALLNWTAVIYEIVKKEGPDIAMTYLVKLEKALPNVPIDRNIFQSLIFTKLLYQHGMKCAINFNSSNLESSEHNTMCSTKIRDQLVEVLEKDLNKPINRNIFGNGPHHWGIHYQNKLSTCPCCTLTLQTPVLLGNNGIAIFSCGHAYHVNCMIEKKLTGCNLHS